ASFRQSVIDTGVTPFSQVPDSGHHRYSGQMALNLPFGSMPRAEYIGAFDLTLAVGGGSLGASGQVAGLTDGNGSDLGGALAFGGGMLMPDADPRRDFLWLADLEGDLTKDGIVYDLSAKIRGDFYGADADGLAGLVYAGAIRQGGDIDIFDGSFAGRAAD
ncbi:MAG: hypothetical protein NWP79_01270, partial [Paracoccaceae bacterium]|nr:hypothetical protein [Paracoccaceae bacterium]